VKCLFANPKVAAYYEGLSPDQIPLIKKTVSRSKTLRNRIDFSRQAFSGLGLLTAAAAAMRAAPEMDIDFFDENMESANLEERLGQGYDLVALGGTIYQMNRMLSLIQAARRKEIPVVVGGAAAMTFPDLFKREGVSVILGESEVLFPDFIKDFQRGAPKTAYEEPTGSGIDLSDSPVPDFSLISKYNYTFIGIQTTRGCPFRCAFCQVSNWLGTKYRHKDVVQIIEEIKKVKSIWPNAFFFFYDDNLFADRHFGTALFEAMASEDICLGRWGTNSDASVFREDRLLKIARGRGRLDYLGIGFESMSQDSLKSIGNPRKADLQKTYGDIVVTMKEMGIGVFAYFMFGFENSRPQDLSAIVDFIKTHDINGQISQLVPMPGTALYHRLVLEYEKENDKIRKGPLGKWYLIRKYLLNKTGMSQAEITGLLADAYTRIYDDARPANKDLLPAPFI
jgi:radical SAM superfamily enzyme YgiQ (UPF0313 family)